MLIYIVYSCCNLRIGWSVELRRRTLLYNVLNLLKRRLVTYSVQLVVFTDSLVVVYAVISLHLRRRCMISVKETDLLGRRIQSEAMT